MRFQSFLVLADLFTSFAESQPELGNVRWTLWIDPGTHTGLAAVLYAVPSDLGPAHFNVEAASKGEKAWSHPNPVSPKDTADMWQHRLEGLKLSAWEDGEPGLPAWGAPGLTGTVLLAVYTEMMLDEHEPQMVRECVARVRRIGNVFAGSGWECEAAIGPAGVGAEAFRVLRADRSHDYVSPLRVRSMFEYALDDEFGLVMASQQPGDALGAFSDDRMKAAGLFIPGPQHPRDALAHALLAIRKAHG